MEERILFVLHLLEITGESGLNHSPCHVDIHPRSLAVGSTAPTGVDEVDACIGGADFCAQHIGVVPRVTGHEGGSEEAGKGCDRFNDPRLCTGQLRCVAHEEPEHRLLVRKFRHRRQNTVGVGGKEENRRRMSATAEGLMLERKERG